MKGLLLFFSITLFSQVARVPLDNSLPPANDLTFRGEKLSSDESKLLINKIDISELDPSENSIWENKIVTLDSKFDSIDLNAGESVNFKSFLKSRNIFRFNAEKKSGDIKTLYLDRYLHTAILRRNFLRKLGYKIPAIKYLKNLKVNFESGEELAKFKEQLRFDTAAASSRWIVSENEFEIVLRDLAVIDLGKDNLYNVAMGVPPKSLNSRTLRSLALAYSLLDVKESVNRFKWNSCEVKSKELVLPHFFDFSFYTTDIHDISWMAKRISKLSRKDLMEVFEYSELPKPVQVLLFNKLVSRIKTCLETLKISHDSSKYTYNSNPKFRPHLLNGRISKINWEEEGYAARFAGEDKKSPLSETGRYLLTLIQSFGIDNAVNQLNKHLSAFDPNEIRQDLAEEQFQIGLKHFVDTGEFLQFPVTSWTSPVLDGELILSRDVVVGNYLGTNNLVQLADTFGFAISPGFVLGLENIPHARGATFGLNVNYVKTFTHLKPLRSLKLAFKEKYRNMIVPLLKRKLTKSIELLKNREFETDVEKQSYIEETFKEISNHLGTGESILITEKFSPSANASIVIPLANTGFTSQLGISGKDIKISRTQIYRKDSKTIQIFEDKGHGFGHTLSMDLRFKVPILRYQRENLRGDYDINVYQLNVDTDLDKNPNFLSNFFAFHDLLKNGSIEMLSEIAPPNKLSSKFNDIYQRFSLLFWRNKKSNLSTHYNLETPSGLKGEYITHYEVHRKGFNYEAFVKELINWQFKRISDDLKWANSIWRNSDETFLGSGKSEDVAYEAQVIDDKIKKEFVSFSLNFKGWAKKKKRLTKLLEKVNDEFKVKLFDINQVHDIKKLNLYDVMATLYIYEDGIEKLKSIPKDVFIRMAYGEEKKKIPRCSQVKLYELSDGSKVPNCGKYKSLINDHSKCEELSDSIESSKCWSRLFSNFSKELGVSKIMQLLPNTDYYLQAQVNGFRSNSEVLNETIYSRSFGKLHSKYPFGILNTIQRRLGINQGEFEGHWLRLRP